MEEYWKQSNIVRSNTNDFVDSKGLGGLRPETEVIEVKSQKDYTGLTVGLIVGFTLGMIVMGLFVIMAK